MTAALPVVSMAGRCENRLAGSVEQTVSAFGATDRDTVVLRLDHTITYEEVEYDRVVFQAREDEPILEPLRDGRTVKVSVYGVPVGHKPSSVDPGDWWRGGLGATASAIPA